MSCNREDEGKGRREERRKSLKALEEEREKSSKALEEEREKTLKAIEEREKTLKALEEERKNGICNLIATCRDFGESLEKVCQRLMRSYHLTHSEATAYLKEYYV